MIADGLNRPQTARRPPQRLDSALAAELLAVAEALNVPLGRVLRSLASDALRVLRQALRGRRRHG